MSYFQDAKKPEKLKLKPPVSNFVEKLFSRFKKIFLLRSPNSFPARHQWLFQGHFSKNLKYGAKKREWNNDDDNDNNGNDDNGDINHDSNDNDDNNDNIDNNDNNDDIDNNDSNGKMSKKRAGETKDGEFCKSRVA